ncbi:MAG TPA: protein kinase [Thermoanaerobaculia bacterium]|nr:protein kinase [Thermoanaerobaculia bacterium]
MSNETPPPRAPGGPPLDATEVKLTVEAPGKRRSVRFTPGTMLADRYRIVALLGKGGMGEVYRAEDVKLGQPVALKFLPSQFGSEPEKLRRLYEEVKLGRQVSHPNVCRVYDVAEVEGNHFISMEYIDGEDLASLLRRIGKLPPAKALEIGRDLCAGLAAAHGLGIIHRDLKPANVMIDGRGDARITDFGLAALADDLEQRREIAGTPAYMAPEQLSGTEITHKTDLYALGLIFYEMYTGRRLFQGESLGEIVSQHSSASSQSLSKETGDIDPAVQRVIVRCLETEPAKRPASIHSVIAALPGGDPLQAAIEAGETPSPEMIAAAGSTGELRPTVAWPILIVTLLLLVACAAISPRVRLYGQKELPLEPVELAIHARQIFAGTDLPRPEDTASELGVDGEYKLWKREQNRAETSQPETGTTTTAATERLFSAIYFGYRESQSSMATSSGDRVSGFGDDPPLNIAGMGQMILEPDGRLRQFIVVPPETTPEGGARDPAEGAPEWSALFTAAGLDRTTRREVAPEWRPPVGSDQRYAWLVDIEGLAEPMRIEAASFEGRPVWFERIAPWKKPKAPAGAALRGMDRIFTTFFIFLVLASFVVGGVLASRNLKRGRGNREGAWRVARFIAVTVFLSQIVMVDHYWDGALEERVLFRLLSGAGFTGLVLWVWYLALEPYLRRRWPRTLISWNRLVQGRWLDPLVGQDIVVGILGAGIVRLIHFLSLAAPAWLGWNAPIPSDRTFLELSGWRYTISYLFSNLSLAMFNVLILTMLLLVAHLLLRRRALAIAVIFLFMLFFIPYETYPVLEWTVRLCYAAMSTWILVRRGMISFLVLLFTILTLDNFPITLDPSVWYFDRSLFGLAILFALAIFGFARSLGSQALFGEPLLEE